MIFHLMISQKMKHKDTFLYLYVSKNLLYYRIIFRNFLTPINKYLHTKNSHICNICERKKQSFFVHVLPTSMLTSDTAVRMKDYQNCYIPVLYCIYRIRMIILAENRLHVHDVCCGNDGLYRILMDLVASTVIIIVPVVYCF